jgi:O-antigen/teichoic acid export membrane protein
MSVLNWITLLDLGFGSGLRNNLSEALAENNTEKAKKLVSTAYISLSGIFLLATVIILPLIGLFNWASILNVAPAYANEIKSALFVSFIGMSILFVLRLLNIIFLVYHKPALGDLLGVIIQFIILSTIYCIGKYSKGSILAFAYVYSLAPLLVYTIGCMIAFYGKHKSIRPSFASFDRLHIKSIANLGLKFFIIQLSALVLFSTDNVIISTYFGAGEVAIYSIPFKYYSVITYGFNIILIPYWSMVTTAYSQGDVKWILKAINKLLLFWVVFVVGGLLMYFFSAWVYHIWLGDKLAIPASLTLIMFLYVSVMNITGIFNTIVYGIGKINVQVILSIAGILINIPLTILLIKYTNLDILAIPIAAIAYGGTVGIIVSIQVYRMLRSKKVMLVNH